MAKGTKEELKNQQEKFHHKKKVGATGEDRSRRVLKDINGVGLKRWNIDEVDKGVTRHKKTKSNKEVKILKVTKPSQTAQDTTSADSTPVALEEPQGQTSTTTDDLPSDVLPAEFVDQVSHESPIPSNNSNLVQEVEALKMTIENLDNYYSKGISLLQVTSDMQSYKMQKLEPKLQALEEDNMCKALQCATEEVRPMQILPHHLLQTKAHTSCVHLRLLCLVWQPLKVKVSRSLLKPLEMSLMTIKGYLRVLPRQVGLLLDLPGSPFLERNR